MKLSLVAALVVLLAVAHGAEAVSVGKRDVQAQVDRITKLIQDMSVRLTTTTQDMVEKAKTLEVANTAQNYMEGSKAKVQPLVERVQADAAKLQAQLKPFIANIEEEFKPLMSKFNAQVKPVTDMMETFFQQVMNHTKALLPPQ